MTTYRAMLDTNIISSLMSDPYGAARKRLERFGVADVCISIISAAELWFGAERTSSRRINAEVAAATSLVAVVPFEHPADQEYGRLRAHLQRLGTPIGPNDLFIAAHALSLGVMLITANVREFHRVPGLRVENWLD